MPLATFPSTQLITVTVVTVCRAQLVAVTVVTVCRAQLVGIRPFLRGIRDQRLYGVGQQAAFGACAIMARRHPE